MPRRRHDQPVLLTDDERRTLAQWARRTTAQRLALRSRLVLACAEGLTNSSSCAVLLETVVRLRRLRAHSATDRWLLLEALALIVAIRAGLFVLPFPSVRRRLERWADVRRGGADRCAREGDRPVARIAWAVNAVGGRVRGTTCLAEALAAHALLRRHGHAPVLRIGVRRGAATPLDAHAWVECTGTVVVGTTAAVEEYTALA